MGNFSWGGRNNAHDHMHTPVGWKFIASIIAWILAFGAILVWVT